MRNGKDARDPVACELLCLIVGFRGAYGSETSLSVSLMIRLGRPAMMDWKVQGLGSGGGIRVTERGIGSAPRFVDRMSTMISLERNDGDGGSSFGSPALEQ